MTDKRTFFIYSLIQELPNYLFKLGGWDGSLGSLPDAPEPWEQLYDAGVELSQLLKDKGEYFKEGGSIFIDYKNLRELNASGSEATYALARRFSLDMTETEILAEAERVVDEWMGAGEVERKG